MPEQNNAGWRWNIN